MKNFIVKVSRTLINRFTAAKIVDLVLAMSAAIFGLPLLFTGTKPFTAAEILVLTDDYSAKKAAYKVGGLLCKPAYLASKLALLNCILAFADYVDSIAKGSVEIIAQSTLPNNIVIDYAALIVAGAKPKGVSGKIGIALQLITNCIAFAPKAGYTAILSEGMPLMAGFSIGSNGQIHIPLGTTNRIFINSTATRRKLFNNLMPSTTYYLYYIQMIGDVVSQMSAPITVGTGVA